jgi:hypothetical protein
MREKKGEDRFPDEFARRYDKDVTSRRSMAVVGRQGSEF